MVQDVENFPLEFYVITFRELEALEHPHIELSYARLADAVSPRITNRARGGWCKSIDIEEIIVRILNVVVIVERCAGVVRVAIVQALI